MGKPTTITWMPPQQAGADILAGDDALMLIVARRAKDGTEIPILVFAIGVQRLFSFDAYFHGSSDGVNELVRHEGRPMSWADVEEIAALVQSQGDEFLGCADRIRERWAIRSEPLPTEIPQPLRSELPCSSCGERHELDAFPIGAVVRVLAQRPRVKRDFVGMVGAVREWSQMGGPVRVRLQFEGLDEFDCPLRENFYPCQLELLDRGNLR